MDEHDRPARLQLDRGAAQLRAQLLGRARGCGSTRGRRAAPASGQRRYRGAGAATCAEHQRGLAGRSEWQRAPRAPARRCCRRGSRRRRRRSACSRPHRARPRRRFVRQRQGGLLVRQRPTSARRETRPVAGPGPSRRTAPAGREAAGSASRRATASSAAFCIAGERLCATGQPITPSRIRSATLTTQQKPSTRGRGSTAVLRRAPSPAGARTGSAARRPGTSSSWTRTRASLLPHGLTTKNR